MGAPLIGRRLTTDERFEISRWPIECVEEVTRKMRGNEHTAPCEDVAVAVRFDPEFGGPYPVCAKHARGDMATLADLLDLWEHCGGTDTKAAS